MPDLSICGSRRTIRGFSEASRMNKGNTLVSPKILIDLRVGRLGHITNITTISGCVKLVASSLHPASS